MKKTLAILMLISLTGCYKQVDRFQLERAIEVCGGIDKVIHIDAYVFMEDFVKCYQFEEYKMIKK